MLYVFNTWVVANIIHPVILYLFFGGVDGDFFHDDMLRFYFFVLLYSFIFSLPTLITAWILFYLIRKINIAANSKFITWFFAATALPLTAWLCLFRMFGEWDLQMEDLKMMLPSSIAVIASIVVRVKQFFKLFNY